jgi:hypothetical protein
MWGTRFCGVSLDVGHPPKLRAEDGVPDSVVSVDVGHASHGRLHIRVAYVLRDGW